MSSDPPPVRRGRNEVLQLHASSRVLKMPSTEPSTFSQWKEGVNYRTGWRILQDILNLRYNNGDQHFYSKGWTCHECRAVGIKYTQEECAVILVREILPCLVELKRIRPYPKECVDDHPDAWRCYTQWLDDAESVVSWTPEEMEPTVAMAVRQLPFYRSYTEKMARMAARQARSAAQQAAPSAPLPHPPAPLPPPAPPAPALQPARQEQQVAVARLQQQPPLPSPPEAKRQKVGGGTAQDPIVLISPPHPTEPPAAARRASGERDEQGSPPAIVKTEPGQQQQQSQGQARREAGTASSTPHAAKPGAAPPQVKQQQEEEQRAGRLPDYMLKAMVQKLYLQTPGEAEEVKRARVAARKALFDAHYVATGIVQDYFSMEESRDRAAAMALRALLEAAQAGVFSEGSM